MGTDINFKKHLGRTYGTRIGLPAFDPAAQAYFAATGITGATQQAAINNLVKGLKTDGIWTKMKAVYPFVTDNINRLSYTEDFSNAFWAKGNSSITTNSVTAPNGTLTADSFVENTASGFHSVSTASGLSLTVQSYTYSVYVKKAVRDWFMISLYDGTTGRDGYFNIANGTLGSVASGATTSITDAGNGWYRCSMTMQFSLSGNFCGYYGASANGTASYTGNGLTSYYIWGAQLELGSTATTYQPIATTQQAFIASQFKYNLVNPVDSDAAFRLVFNGGWTHSSNGATPNGTNGYADTKLNPISSLSSGSKHLSFYSRTQNTLGNRHDIGCEDSVLNKNLDLFLYFQVLSKKGFIDGNYPTNSAEINNTNTLGYQIGSRTSSSNQKLYFNNSLIATNTTPLAVTDPNFSLYIGATNTNNTATSYSIRQTAFATIGDGLLDAEASALYNHVQNFQLALNRAV
jgi:hypothetical protein